MANVEFEKASCEIRVKKGEWLLSTLKRLVSSSKRQVASDEFEKASVEIERARSECQRVVSVELEKG